MQLYVLVSWAWCNAGACTPLKRTAECVGPWLGACLGIIYAGEPLFLAQRKRDASSHCVASISAWAARSHGTCRPRLGAMGDGTCEASAGLAWES